MTPTKQNGDKTDHRFYQEIVAEETNKYSVLLL